MTLPEVSVAVLGPVTVSRDGRPVRLARRQHRLILGILALESGRAVGRNRLIDLVWGDDPPDAARALIYSRVSELRTILGVNSLESTSDSYILHLRCFHRTRVTTMLPSTMHTMNRANGCQNDSLTR